MSLLSYSVVFLLFYPLMRLITASVFLIILYLFLRKNESIKFKYWKNVRKFEREKTIVAIYNSGHSIDDIQRVSGFISRSSVS